MDVYSEAYDIFAFYSAPVNTNYTITPGQKHIVGIFSYEDDTIDSSIKTWEHYRANLAW